MNAAISGNVAKPHNPTVDPKFAEQLRMQNTDDFLARLGGFNKFSVPREQLPQLRAVLDEALTRMATLPHRAYRDLVIVANAGRLYEYVLALYAAREAYFATDVLFSVIAHVVDAAYFTQNVALLEQLAESAAKKTMSRPREVVSDLSLYRILWRLQCLTIPDEANERIAPRLSHSEAAAITERLWHHCVVPVHASLRSDCAAHGLAVPPLGVTLSDFAAATRRCVLYNAAVDMGEMHYFRHCKTAQLFRFGAITHALAAHGAATVPHIDAEGKDMYFQVLLRTCIAGLYVDIAAEYFAELQEGRTEVAEFNFFSYLSVLTAAKDQKKITAVARELLDSGAAAGLGHGIVATLATAAGHTRDRGVALGLLRVLMDAGRRGSSNSGSAAGVAAAGGATTQPTPFAVFAALTAVAKCHDAALPEYIAEAQARRLLGTDAEMICYLHLMNGLWSADPLAAATAARQAMRPVEEGGEGVPLTQRLAHVLLKIYLRVESAEFLPFYRLAVTEYGLFKREWLEELVFWADRRRYDLTRDERQFILDEVRRAAGGSLDLKGAMAGLEGIRTHAALIAYDLEHDPCVQMRARGVVTPEQLVRDSRVHFLLRKGKRAVETRTANVLREWYERRDVCMTVVAHGDRGGAAAGADEAVVEHLMLPKLHFMQVNGTAGIVDF